MKTIEFIKNLKTELLSTIVEVQEFLSEVTLDVKKQGLKALLSFLKESGYEVLMDLTGVDYIHPEKWFIGFIIPITLRGSESVCLSPETK
jgi:NADH:ubiquinone oxidoreductase subunit C